MLCSKKATDVSHEANGEAFCPDVCELLQLAMLKDFLFRAIKLLSAQIVQRGCSGSVLSALFCSCLSVSSALLCSCCSVLSTLLCVCRSLLSVLPCLVYAPRQLEQQLQQQQQLLQQQHVQQQLAWPHTKLSNGLAAQLCAWTVWLHVQLGTLMLVTAAADQLYCWGVSIGRA